MYRQKFLKHGIISTGLLMSIFFWNAGILRADTPEAPLFPMSVEFRYVPQYLDESIPDDPRYARIQALLDEDGCHVILLDKTTDREAFYSTSKRRVDALAANGSDAYITPVDFTASLPKDASLSFLIHFQDRFGNEVSWKFVVGRIVPHASPEVISRTNNSGIIFLYAPRRAPSVDGTSLIIGGREYLPKSTQSADAPATFYATDMTLGQIMPGTELWAVERSPSDMTKTASWNAAGDGARRRTLAVKELSATEASIEQFDVNDPNAPHVILNLVRVNDAWELRSLSFETHFNTLRIFFGPQLPLPARQTDDRRIVTFTVSENELSSIASGKLEVRRAADAEHVFWRFDTPGFTRGITLETGVNLVPGARVQANDTNEDGSDLLR
jgi:hypothetical protein